MFHKGKRHRRFPTTAGEASAQERGDASFIELSELMRMAATFEPAWSELNPHRFDGSQDAAEAGPKPAGDELTRTRKVSEIAAGERVFHFGCYLSAARLYPARKT
jgi:hypothetical protein